MRTVPEWIATKSDDEAVPPRVRQRVFIRFDGKCAGCGRRIGEGALAWDCDHIIALALGGQHREGNLRALCRAVCHRDKTRDDAALRKRFNASQKKRAGIKKRRTITIWRKFNGEIVHASRER
jgi:5-methylcytosine-specific restriction endonuclease McrA